MTDLDDAIERFARPRRNLEPLPVETEEVAGEWALQQLLGETVIALRRRGVEPVPTLMAATSPRGTVYREVAACWPLEIFALSPRGAALPYMTATTPEAGMPVAPSVDHPVLVVSPTPLRVGEGPADVEVNRRGQLLWRWSSGPRGHASAPDWTPAFRERFEANWSDRRSGPLVDPIGFAIVDHLDGHLAQGVAR